jgi:hypothetical protein
MPPRSSALRTVAAVSIDCSSPKRHGRVEPVSSPAWPTSSWSCSPYPPSASLAKTLRSAVSPSRLTALGVSSSLPSLLAR